MMGINGLNRVGKGLNVILRKFNFILSPLKSFSQGRGRPKTSLERLSEQDESERKETRKRLVRKLLKKSTDEGYVRKYRRK